MLQISSKVLWEARQHATFFFSITAITDKKYMTFVANLHTLATVLAKSFTRPIERRKVTIFVTQDSNLFCDTGSNVCNFLKQLLSACFKNTSSDP